VVEDYPQSSFTFGSNVVSVLEFSCKKVGKEAILYTVLQIDALGGIITSLPTNIQPLSGVQGGYGINYDGVTTPNIAWVQISSLGIEVATYTTHKIYMRLSVRWRLDI
jgi:hypothetical protein